MIKFLSIALPFAFMMSNGRGAEANDRSPLQVEISLDKNQYIPAVPVYLDVKVTNDSDQVVSLKYGGEWPPPWQTSQSSVNAEFVFADILDGAELRVSPSDGVSFKKRVAKLQEQNLEDARVPQDGLLVLAPHESKAWRKPLPFVFSKHGEFSVFYKLPPIVIVEGQQQRPIAVERELFARVADESATLEGIDVSVELLQLDNDTGVPVLKWKIAPKEPLNVPAPSIQSCRIVLRETSGRVLKDLISQPPAELGHSDAKWTEPVEWELPLKSESFDAIDKSAPLFPGPGKYNVEIIYRDFLPDLSAQSKYPDAPSISFVTTDAQLQDNTQDSAKLIAPSSEVDPTQVAPLKGKWIAFRKTFEILITADHWQKMVKK